MRPPSFIFILANEHYVSNTDTVLEMFDGCRWVLVQSTTKSTEHFSIYNLYVNNIYRHSNDGGNGLAAMSVNTSGSSHIRNPIVPKYFSTRELTDDEINVLCENNPDTHVKRKMWAGFKIHYIALSPINTELELLSLTHYETNNLLHHSRRCDQAYSSA